MIACLLDDGALLALGQGCPALSGFIVDAAAGRAVLAVPALCLCAAEASVLASPMTSARYRSISNPSTCH